MPLIDAKNGTIPLRFSATIPWPPAGPAVPIAGISTKVRKAAEPTQTAATRTCTTRSERKRNVIDHLLRLRCQRGHVSSRWSEPMNKTRLEAFSDGVIAILITIMVLELKIPHGTDWRALQG